MQLNTIAGRTYNDLNQYPVVRGHGRGGEGRGSKFCCGVHTYALALSVA